MKERFPNKVYKFICTNEMKIVFLFITLFCAIYFLKITTKLFGWPHPSHTILNAIIETIVLFTLLNYRKKGTLAFLSLNLISHPIAQSLFYKLHAPFIIVELLVVLFEAKGYKMLMKEEKTKEILICNLITIIAGLLL